MRKNSRLIWYKIVAYNLILCNNKTMKTLEDALITFFRNGCTSSCSDALGVEIEHFIVDQDTEEAFPYLGSPGVREILMELSECYPGAESMYGEDFFGFTVPDFSITLEPAAQLEISMRSTMDIREIETIYRDFREKLDRILGSKHAKALTVGCQPVSRVRDLPLIPKERYHLMDSYFTEIQSDGVEMMRGTASVQVSIDYADEADFRRKIQAVSFTMPFLKLFSDNAETFEGKPLSTYLKRTDIWNRTDPVRCGILPGVFSETYGFRDYAEFLCRVPLIFRQEGDQSIPTGMQTGGEVYKGKELTEQDVLHVLSMAFPDVRLKHYLEIRAADSMPAPFMLAYTALIKGLFYQEAFLSDTAERIRREQITEESVRQAEEALMKDGWEATIYGRSVREQAKELLTIAKNGLPENEKRYLSAMEDVIRYGGIRRLPKE